MPRTSSDQLADNLHDFVMEMLPSLVKEKVTEQVKKEVPAQDDPHDDAHPEGENSAKRQKTSEYEAYVSGESSSGQVNVEEPGPSTSVIQDIMEEISLTNDEVEFLKLFEEEIEVRLNYRDQMRRWEMYVNGRPLGPRRERPE
ncbi:hypothetical protein Tco_0786883 [Tanacetum coccineum]